MMKTLVYLSRAFVEFGPFTIKEMKDFHSRGLLRDIDHIRQEGEDHWVSVDAWAAGMAVPAKAPAKSKAKAKSPEPKPAAPAAKPKTASKKAKKTT